MLNNMWILLINRCPGIAVHDFHSGTKKERERNKLKVQRRGHVLLTSYGMIVNNVNLLTEMDGSEFVWVCNISFLSRMNVLFKSDMVHFFCFFKIHKQGNYKSLMYNLCFVRFLMF